jgi:membrane glycosyltransferase
MPMGIKYSNKINKIRTFALSLVFLGILVMYIGIFFRTHEVIMVLAMILGFLCIIASTAVYFWIGMISTRAIPVVCPECGKPTKVLGRVDACMHCDQPLTLDRSLEGKEFDEKYNLKGKKRVDG